MSSATVAWGELPPRHVLEQRAVELGTDGVSSQQAHEMLLGERDWEFAFPSIILGLEKTYRNKIRTRASPSDYLSSEEKAILSRFVLPKACSGGAVTKAADALQARQCELVRQQQSTLRDYFDGGKRTFISHIGYFEGPAASSPKLLHNVYLDCGASLQPQHNSFDCKKSVYDNSWKALEQLRRFVAQVLEAQDFSHILLMSKGWNTTQNEAVEFYQLLPKLISEVAGSKEGAFRPLVVGLSWHSSWVWGVSEIPLVKVVPSVASYGNKAKDADEIGITWANALLNEILLPIAATHKVPVVAIGHSFGARLLTRAGASAALLGLEPENKLSLLLSLQGAFSMNRFLPERCSGTEGAPYADLTAKTERVVLVWSNRDRANPVAQMISQATHVGGAPGHRRARAYGERFDFRKWGPGWVSPKWSSRKGPGEECIAMDLPKQRVEMVDASAIVSNHGDVDDLEMARLIWTLLQEKPR